MSITFQQKNNCKHKKKLDKKGALTARNFAWQKEHVDLKIYPCPVCHHWHLTSKGRGL